MNDENAPAPLDPGSVKAGDTVEVVVTPVGHAPEYIVKGGVWASSAGELFVGREELASVRVSLLAHTPAPEPEPEWEPGDMAAVTARGWINGWSVRTAANDGWASHSESDDVRSDAEVESVRPLVVIDPAAVDVEALVDASYRSGADTRHLVVLAFLEHLGIEAPRA